MAKISGGTVTVTNGSKALVFTDGKIYDKAVKEGAMIKFDGTITVKVLICYRGCLLNKE